MTNRAPVVVLLRQEEIIRIEQREREREGLCRRNVSETRRGQEYCVTS